MNTSASRKEGNAMSKKGNNEGSVYKDKRNRQIFHVPHKEKTLADFGEGFSIFSFKFQYFINITNHILVLYLSLFQTYGFQKSNKCIGLFILI